MDSSNQFATSPLINGNIYAADFASPTPSVMITAINDMQTAYTDASGRTLPDYTELESGDIGGLTLTPGLYKWSTGVTIPADVTLSGNSTDIWIFQIAQTLDISSATQIILIGGAQPKNIFWQVAGQTTLGTASVFNGNILSQTAIVLNTGATLNGRALAQTAVILDSNNISSPIELISDILPPVITLNGASSINVSLGSVYIDAGATAEDNLDITAVIFEVSTVDTSIIGEYTVTYTATDTAGNTAILIRTINVIVESPVLTTITLSPTYELLTAGDTLQLKATSLDQFGAPINAIISYSSSVPSTATVDAVSGLVTAVAFGISTTITARSGNVSGIMLITIDSIAPVLSPIGPRSVTQGNLLNFTITATSPEGLDLAFMIAVEPPTTATLTDHQDGTATFNWMPDLNDVGTTNVRFIALDGRRTTYEDVAIIVNAFPAPTTISTNLGNVEKNADYNIALNATGFNNTPVAYINYSLNNVSGQINGSFGNVLINTNGNNALIFYAVDILGNIETPNTIYALLNKNTPSPEGGNGNTGSSGGGGGGGITATTVIAAVKTYIPANAELSIGYANVLSKNDIVKFVSSDNDIHSITISDLSATDVKITLASTPQIVVMKSGETKKFELTWDNKYDLEIAVGTLNTGSVTMVVKTISEDIYPVVEQLETVSSTTQAETTPASASAANSEVTNGNGITGAAIGAFVKKPLTLGIIALLLIAIVYSIVVLRKINSSRN